MKKSKRLIAAAGVLSVAVLAGCGGNASNSTEGTKSEQSASAESTKDELIEGGSVGRKLDFIAQEMNREANTILSKANDLETSNCAISLKTEIEKVREQIQNIE